MKNDTKHQLKSPLRFLNSYREEDFHLFYGRNREVNRIFTLFEKTNLVVVYGPSGSGKSSVALCGLTNRHYNWKPILIRKNDNIIDSFFEEIEVLFDRKDCLRLKGLFLKISEIITSTKNNRFKKQTAKAKAEAAAHRTELNETIEILFQDLKYIPFFIFDQFEELFIQGTKEEVEQFSILLSLITSKVLLSNVVLCIQTEFFAHLLELEGHNKNILDYKCHVDDPSKDDVAEIIRKTFESFDINQNTVDSRNNNGEPLPEEIKEKRINLIIKKLGKNDDTNKVHLPFLQIYLNKLYIDDFIKTYPNEKELLLNPSQINFEEKPLEFTESEIKSHGDIIDILVNYLNDVNTALITNTKNKIQGEKHRHTVIKLLKHFVTEKNTKKAIEVESIDSTQSNYLYIKEPKIKNAIIQDIWFDSNINTDDSLVEMIDELINARILKENGNFIELSHNLLARVITKIPVDKDILDNYKYQFNTAFATYQEEKRDFEKKKKKYKKSQLTLLNPTWVKRIGRDINYIIPIDEKDSERREFWKKSEFEVHKKRLMLVAILIGSLLLFITSAIFWGISVRAKKELTITNRNLEEKEKQQQLINKVGNVLVESRIDRTSAYKILNGIEAEIKDQSWPLSEFSIFNNTKNDFIADFIEKPLYLKKITVGKSLRNRHILSTKSRPYPGDDSKLILFAETNQFLYSAVYDLTSKEQGAIKWKQIKKPEATGFAPIKFSYKPYKLNNEIRVLYSNVNGTFDSDFQFTKSDTISESDDMKELLAIEHMSGRVFIALHKNKKRLIKIDLNKSKSKQVKRIYIPEYALEIDDAVPTPRNLNKASLGFLKKSSDNTICYLATFEKTPYIFKYDVDRNKIVDHFGLKDLDENLDVNDVRSLQIDSDEKMVLIADSNVIYNLDLGKFDNTRSPDVPKTNANHRGSIKSISNYGQYTLIGTENKTASVYYDQSYSMKGEEIISQVLIGHTDAILNVSFRKVGGKLYAITSGQDGTINIWDLSPMEIKSARMVQARSPINLVSHRDSLFAAFVLRRYYLRKDSGYLMRYNSSLESDEEDESPKLKIKNARGTSITAVGFHGNKMIAGLNSGRIKYADSEEDIFKRGPEYGIRDLKVKENRMAFSTKAGIFFLNLDNPNNSLKEKLPDVFFNSVDLHPHSNIIIATSDDGNIYQWDVDNDQLEIYDYHKGYVRDACFSDDGRYMVSASWDNTAVLWKKVKHVSDSSSNANPTSVKYEKTGRSIKHSSDVEGVAISKDGIIATASSDQTVLLHKIVEGKETTLVKLPSLIRHNFGLRSVVFDATGNFIYTVDAMGHIKKWDYHNFEGDIKKRISH